MKPIIGMFDNLWSFTTGCAMSVLGYFLPIKDIVHFVIILFTIDVFVGYLAARKLRKEKFSTKIIWDHTVPRMLFSILIIIATYMWDETFNQKYINTYSITGWWFSGVLLLSILKNAYQITKWDILPKISANIKNKIDNETK